MKYPKSPATTLVLCVALLLTTLQTHAQWNRNAAKGVIYPANLTDYLVLGTNPDDGRGILDVGGASEADIYLIGASTTNTKRTAYIPGHVFLIPYDGSDVAYLQARRKDNIGSSALQFRTVSSGNLIEAVRIDRNGNMGIGTTAPTARLDVISEDVQLQLQNSAAGGSTWRVCASSNSWVIGGGKFLITTSSSDNSSFVIDAQKRVGVGIVNPETRLHVAEGIMSLDGTAPTVYMGSGTGELSRYLMFKNTPATPTSAGIKVGGMLVSDTYTYANPSKNDLVVKGNVSIGTPTVGTYMLAVNGKVGAKEVRVEKTSSAWPDYVFASDYRLPALSDVEQYVQRNHHLPEVPSAQEVNQSGHDLGAMDAVLLKKVEELTLYAIDQQKMIDQQQTMLQQQMLLLQQQQKEIEAMKEALKK